MPDAYTFITSVLYLAAGVFIFLVGLTVLRVGQSSAPNRAAALMLFFAGIGPLLSGTGMILESSLRPGSVVYKNMLESFEYLWEFYFPSLMLFSLSFPRVNPLLRFPLVVLLVFLPYIVHLAVMMSGDRLLEVVGKIEDFLPTDKPVTIGGREFDVAVANNIFGTVLGLLERAHRYMFALVNIIYSGAAITLLWRSRSRVVNPRLERQMRTLVIGLTVSAVVYTVTKVFFGGVAEETKLALINFALISAGGTIVYAVIRQQLLGIRYVLRRVILYSGVAMVFALIYLVVVRPVSEYFGQYSSVGENAIETGCIIIAIIAFQPLLMRTEEVLSRFLLEGRADIAGRFRRLGDAVTAVTSIGELETVLSDGLRDIVDASATRLELSAGNPEQTPLITALENIGDAIGRAELLRLHERPRKAGKRRLRDLFSGGSGRDLSTIADLFGDSATPPYEVYVPVFRGKRCIGYLGLREKIYSVPYSSVELGHLSLLATQVSSSIENVRLLRENVERKVIEEELKIARKIQTQLLPGEPPPLPGFELSARTVPSRWVGGDYYDYILVDETHLVVVVADVSGKGIPASILTASLQAAVRSNEDVQTDPKRMMHRLNALLFRNTSDEEFATLFYGVVDLETGRLRYANAGHEFPFVVTADGANELAESGIVLGALEEFDYEMVECEIPRGGTLAIFTDGVPDWQKGDGEYYGTGRLRAVLERCHNLGARETCQGVIDDVREFGQAESPDDLTLVVLKRGG